MSRMFLCLFTSIKWWGKLCNLHHQGPPFTPRTSLPSTLAGSLPKTISFTSLTWWRNLLYPAQCPKPVFLPKLPMVQLNSQPVAPGLGKQNALHLRAPHKQSSVQGLSLRYGKGLQHLKGRSAWLRHKYKEGGEKGNKERARWRLKKRKEKNNLQADILRARDTFWSMMHSSAIPLKPLTPITRSP